MPQCNSVSQHFMLCTGKLLKFVTKIKQIFSLNVDFVFAVAPI